MNAITGMSVWYFERAQTSWMFSRRSEIFPVLENHEQQQTLHHNLEAPLDGGALEFNKL